MNIIINPGYSLQDCDSSIQMCQDRILANSPQVFLKSLFFYWWIGLIGRQSITPRWPKHSKKLTTMVRLCTCSRDKKSKKEGWSIINCKRAQCTVLKYLLKFKAFLILFFFIQSKQILNFATEYPCALHLPHRGKKLCAKKIQLCFAYLGVINLCKYNIEWGGWCILYRWASASAWTRWRSTSTRTGVSAG